MDTFEYLTVFVSIILGLGMTYLIFGVGNLLSRKGYQFYWIHLLQIISTCLLLMNSWWLTYSWAEIKNLTFLHYLFIMCSPIALVLASSLLFPIGNKKKNKNLKKHYFSVCRPYYILVSLRFPLDIIDTIVSSDLLTGSQKLAELGDFYIFLMVISFIIVLLASLIRNPFYHGFVQVYILIQLAVGKIMFNPTLEAFT